MISTVKNIALLILLTFLLMSCSNPFAPKLSTSDQLESALSDQKSVEGFFQNFRYAYSAKDTTIYGNLLHPDFIFVYRNYDNYQQAVDVSWGREEDLITTARLFNATQNIDLTWNNITVSIGDSLEIELTRAFTLTIMFNPSDIIDIHGNANMRLKRNSTDEIWKMIRWRDESNF